MPWKLCENGNYLHMAYRLWRHVRAVGGIMIADYFIVKNEVGFKSLYQRNGDMNIQVVLTG